MAHTTTQRIGRRSASLVAGALSALLPILVVGSALPAQAASNAYAVALVDVSPADRTLLLTPCDGPARFKPRSVTLSCYFSDPGSYEVRAWRAWTRLRAVAIAIDRCTGEYRPPQCGRRARLVFDRPQVIDGSRVFTRVRTTYPSMADGQRYESVLAKRKGPALFTGCRLIWEGVSDAEWRAFPLCESGA